MKQHIEQIRKKAEAAWEGCHHCNEYDREFWINGYITGALESQIELPSDEEIEKQAEYFEYTDGIYGFTQCAKWMKEQIQGGNK